MMDSDSKVYAMLINAHARDEINEYQFKYYADKLFSYPDEVKAVAYNDYLLSDIWKEKRRKIIKLYNNECYICGNQNNLQVHHLTYERLGAELEDDLVCLCADCHSRIHEIKDFISAEREENKELFLTPKTDALEKGLKSQLIEVQKQINSLVTRMKTAECLEDGSIVKLIADMYSGCFGDATIRKHLPKIGRIISETCNLRGFAPYITKAISSATKANSEKKFLHSLSFVRENNANSKNCNQHDTQQHKRSEPFTPEQLEAAWKHFIEQNPSYIILLSAMRNSSPVHVKDTTYRVEVENNVQVEALNSNMSKLLGFLHNEVENDSLSLQVVCAPKAIESVPYTPKRIFINKRL